MKEGTRGLNKLMVKSIRINYLLYGLLMYVLGICIAVYLNLQIDWINVLLGYLAILLLQILEGLIGLTKAKPVLIQDHKEITKRQTLLAVIAVLMMVLAFLLVSLLLRGGLTGAGWLFMLIIGLICILRPSSSFSGKLVAFHEVFDAVLVVGIIPMFAFNIISGELHTFLVFITLPLFFIFLGTQIALSYPKYSKELTKNIPSLLIQIGWQRGIFLHNILVFTGFLSLGIFGMIGLPWALLWPTMIVSLIGIFEIILLHRIGEGYKPNWKLLKLVAHGLIGLSTYTMIFSLLIN
jgi:hypothetical protein